MKSVAAISLILFSAISSSQEAAVIVNGEKVTSSEYFRKMEYLGGLGRKSRTGDMIELLPAIATIDAIVTEKLLWQLAREKNLFPTPADIDKELAYNTRKNPKVVEMWQSTGRTVEELKRQITTELAQFRLQTNMISVTQSEIENLYNLAKEARFTLPQKVKLRVITVRSKQDSESVDADLKSGKSFSAVAVQWSTDLSAKIGGDFGEIPISLLSPEVGDAVSRLKRGERTSWIKSDDVLAKFQLDEIIPKQVKPLDDDLREDLRRELLMRKGSTKNDLPKMIKEAREKAKIEVSNSYFDKAYKDFIGFGKKIESNGG